MTKNTEQKYLVDQLDAGWIVFGKDAFNPADYEIVPKGKGTPKETKRTIESLISDVVTMTVVCAVIILSGYIFGKGMSSALSNRTYIISISDLTSTQESE